MIYHTCPLCGANLDPGERCDCTAEEKKANSPSASAGGQTDGKDGDYGKAEIRKAENGHV